MTPTKAKPVIKRAIVCKIFIPFGSVHKSLCTGGKGGGNRLQSILPDKSGLFFGSGVSASPLLPGQPPEGGHPELGIQVKLPPG